MKKLYLPLCSVALALLFCVGCGGHAGDVRNAKWDMTIAEVKKTEKEPPQTETAEMLQYNTDLYNIPMKLTYNFIEGKLYGALFDSSINTDVNETTMGAIFQTLVDNLTKTYGDPSSDDDIDFGSGNEQTIITWVKGDNEIQAHKFMAMGRPLLFVAIMPKDGEFKKAIAPQEANSQAANVENTAVQKADYQCIGNNYACQNKTNDAFVFLCETCAAGTGNNICACGKPAVKQIDNVWWCAEDAAALEANSELIDDLSAMLAPPSYNCIICGKIATRKIDGGWWCAEDAKVIEAANDADAGLGSGEYWCMGKDDTCNNKTSSPYDLYCSSCD